jgi:hypothetical protein
MVKTGFCQREFRPSNEHQRYLNKKLNNELHGEILYSMGTCGSLGSEIPECQERGACRRSHHFVPVVQEGLHARHKWKFLPVFRIRIGSNVDLDPDLGI